MLRSLLLQINFSSFEFETKAKKFSSLFYTMLAVSITHYHYKTNFLPQRNRGTLENISASMSPYFLDFSYGTTHRQIVRYIVMQPAQII